MKHSEQSLKQKKAWEEEDEVPSRLSANGNVDVVELQTLLTPALSWRSVT